jgi:hypothetical protein
VLLCSEANCGSASWTLGRLVLHRGRTSKGLDNLQLAFDSQSLRSTCEIQAQAESELGADVAETLRRRLADLRAAATVHDLIAGLPTVGPDGLHLFINVGDGHRIVLMQGHVKCPRTKTNDVDWARVSRVKIMKIESING